MKLPVAPSELVERWSNAAPVRRARTVWDQPLLGSVIRTVVAALLLRMEDFLLVTGLVVSRVRRRTHAGR